MTQIEFSIEQSGTSIFNGVDEKSSGYQISPDFRIKRLCGRFLIFDLFGDIGMIFISVITTATVPNSWPVDQEPAPYQIHSSKLINVVPIFTNFNVKRSCNKDFLEGVLKLNLNKL